MNKKAYFYVDDVIWLFRDLTRQKPDSMFDNPFLNVFKTAHDKYGLKVQLNVFYRTDFFYGSDEFTLSDMTDAYKSEWEEASDWLKLGFHSKQEFPDYPYINADYTDVAKDINSIKSEIYRFAGEKSFAQAVVPHWLPISKDGCRALKDAGIKITAASTGETSEYDGNSAVLPYGHSFRLLHNRKPETKLFHRGTRDVAIDVSLCGYNHFSSDVIEPLIYNMNTYYDSKTSIHFKKFCNGPCVNLYKLNELDETFEPLLNYEYVGYGIHEQYFYSDYFAYQSDYRDKILKCAEILHNHKFEHFFVEELV